MRLLAELRFLDEKIKRAAHSVPFVFKDGFITKALAIRDVGDDMSGLLAPDCFDP